MSWTNWAENAKSSMTQALEKTGDAISKAATQAGKSAREQQQQQQRKASSDDPDAPATTPSGRYDEPTIAALPEKRQEILNNLSQGWSSVVENTKASMKQAEEKVKHQQVLLQERLSKARAAYYKRDPSLPLDVDALKDAEVVYITDRIITMGHPALPSQVNGDITGERKLAAVGHLLNRRHDGRYMVWNLSEVDYDVDILDDQVLTFSFPGSPSPPLGLMLKLLVSMESWLKADDRNVAVVHCLTGKGRTSTVLAAFLCWMGQANFSDIYEALEYIAACKQITAEELTIPSQRRYASYFKNMLDGVRPSQPPLMLRRVIMSEAPRYAKGPPRKPVEGEEGGGDKKIKPGEDDSTQLLGCVPYLQIFKAGKLLHTAPASLHFQQGENELPFCQVADGSISFHINLVVQGDILVRARHLTAAKKKVSMFRAAFHTGYAPPNVMRLTKSQLDGACDDDRFVPEFFVDFIFEPVDAEAASKLLQDSEEKKPEPSVTDTPTDSSPADGKESSNMVQASSDDTMLQGDSRFWQVISTRMKEHATDNKKQGDEMWGPTVGRRRDMSSSKEDSSGGDGTAVQAAASEQQRNALETFSIGGEFDFLPETVEPETAKARPSPEPSEHKPPKKDSLMEALMGALDDDDDDDEHNEEQEEEIITFGETEEQQTTAETAKVDVAPEAEAKTDTAAEATTDSGKATETPATDAPPSVAAPAGESDDSKKQQTPSDDMAALLADASLNVDEDMDALLASAGVDNASDDDLLDLGAMGDDDEELEDFANFLSK